MICIQFVYVLRPGVCVRHGFNFIVLRFYVLCSFILQLSIAFTCFHLSLRLHLRFDFACKLNLSFFVFLFSLRLCFGFMFNANSIALFCVFEMCVLLRA